MRRCRFLVALLLILAAGVAPAQTFPTPKYFSRFFARAELSSQVPGSKGIETYIVDGKLRLGLEDMIALTLANNTDVRMNALQLQLTRFSLQRTYQPFDPIFTTRFNPARSTSMSTNTTIDGVSAATAATSLTHGLTFSYSQTFQTGTGYSVSLGSTRSASNNQSAVVNPSISSTLTFSLSQPLLRGRGLLPNRAPIVIAQRNLKQSRADFEGQLNSSISNAINQYWDVVQARQELEVMRKSLELAEASYNRDKRALELGALSPLDIYRSEGQVAQRKLSIVQSEYRLKQLEDDFRRTIGADLDSRFSSLPIELTETAKTSGELPVVDAQEAMQKALASRPELESLRLQLDNDSTNAKVAAQNLKPDLSFNGYYTSNGVNQIITSDGQVVRGGFADALDQVRGFNYPSYGVTLQLRLPLRNRAAEADFGTSLVNRKRDLYSMKQRTQSITLEVRDALNQIEGAKLAIAAAKVSLEIARKNLEAEQRKYDLGAETIFFVLDAQNLLTQAEQSVVEADISYQRALTALDRADGELLAKHRVQIDSAAN